MNTIHTIGFVFVLIQSIILVIASDWVNEGECGTRPLRTPKIINGTTAVHGHHPWIISLQLNNRHHCGGSLIRPNWVLTAAHCVYRLKADRFRVKLGGHRRNISSEETSINSNVSSIYAHNGFNYATFADDVALVKLEKNMPYSDYIRPICLPSSNSDQRVKHASAIVAGWGKLQQGGLSAEVLQELELPLIENELCQRWYRQQGRMLIIRSTQICAGVEQGGKDACQGDSGSPLFVVDSITRRSKVIGIVSAGIGCALPKLPGLYTRVTSYIDWIDRTIRADETSSNIVSVDNSTLIPNEVTTTTTNNSDDTVNTTVSDTITSTTLETSQTISSLTNVTADNTIVVEAKWRKPFWFKIDSKQNQI